MLPTLGQNVRIWSAGCSSGEEPYTLAMLLLDHSMSGTVRDARVLATDISQRMLVMARAGVYPAEIMSDVPADWQRRYWTRLNRNDETGSLSATPGLAKDPKLGPISTSRRSSVLSNVSGRCCVRADTSLWGTARA